MNLFLALFWLLCAVVLFAYEHFIGEAKVRLRWGGDSLSAGWLMLVLAAYNLVRWWSARTYRAEQRAAEITRAGRDWERRHRHTESPSGPPDPNFNFTGDPPPPRDITDQPPPDRN